MGIFDGLTDKNISSEDKKIAYERCKHIVAPEDSTPEVVREYYLKRKECQRIQADILYYSKIQHLCVKSGEFIEDNRYVNNEHYPWKNCWKEDYTTEEYIEKYGFDPHKECFKCEKDEAGKMIDEREICNPCNQCIDFTYDGDCTKWKYWYLIFDAKACRYWRNPTSDEVIWFCEEQAIRAWEEDTPPKSHSKQQISFHDHLKQEGDFCPKDRHRITGDPEKDKYIPKTPNSFKWCVPRWNDQCRFFVIQFHYNVTANSETITTKWKFLKKCNQEECDLAEDEREGSSMNHLPRHANICIKRCYDINNKYAVYPQWHFDLVNYKHNGW